MAPWSLILGVFLSPAPVEQTGADLHVLLAASAGTREYQFLRTHLVRTMAKKQSEVCVYLQLAADKADRKPILSIGLDEKRHLAQFPDTLLSNEKADVGEKYQNLNLHDVVVAFDLDWSLLNAKQVETLSKWVEDGGGLIFVAGPVHTGDIALKDSAGCQLLRKLLPVELDKLKGTADRDKPARLHFSKAVEGTTMLKLDPKGDGATAGWERFFSDRPTEMPSAPLVRGFYSYYPVKAVKKDAVVLATMAEPAAKLADGQEQPFLVTGKLGKGRVVYLSSGELWRVRQLSEQAHETLWLQLLQYAAGRESKK